MTKLNCCFFKIRSTKIFAVILNVKKKLTLGRQRKFTTGSIHCDAKIKPLTQEMKRDWNQTSHRHTYLIRVAFIFTWCLSHRLDINWSKTEQYIDPDLKLTFIVPFLFQCIEKEKSFGPNANIAVWMLHSQDCVHGLWWFRSKHSHAHLSKGTVIEVSKYKVGIDCLCIAHQLWEGRVLWLETDDLYKKYIGIKTAYTFMFSQKPHHQWVSP